ncbi:MAG: HU family DNA-binding protein [Hominisplanchenecus sp.]|jgi:DNA-binding protein HU-beta|uniref:HU family DNA-binding protein n=2 Tax=Lachnospiraceae TaxID=186803 RepID=A0ABS8EX56_9FIRM|nr:MULTISPECIES: HU family DNA-binding protein [Clostridia]MEE0297403.1 HU family DNA-binding protein [Lachnospiraceae bacterium]MCB5866684.1 HU family DNA-binding protein [Faecalicatena fissicatena]MCC2148744.1 HU family DNA-binding protein [Hominisplanchenecus faecis]NSD75715.1 HU family DNA-binding protein [Faecalicatena fissicatena]NSD82440.1 HU family DNA-binding protein [Faecalicatena fissicatena]
MPQPCSQESKQQLQEERSMNKTELVAAIAEQTELSKKDAEKALKAFTDIVADELKKGEKVQLVGFGTFEVSERAAREGRNPQSGEPMTIAASKAPKFKAGKALKDMINN